MPFPDGQVSWWIVNSVSRGVASRETELVRSPEGRSATLERGGEVMRCRGFGGGLGGPRARRRSLRGFEGGPRMGRTTELGRGPSANWASSGSGEDFFLSRIAVE